MRLSLILALPLFTAVSAFTPCRDPCRNGVHEVLPSLQMGYVPDGMTPKQWKKKQEGEKNAKKEKNFAAFGPQTFKSRSLQAFQKDLEKGKVVHLLPVLNAKERVKKGEIKVEDIPYMQRGGSWDNSDVKGVKKKVWGETDKTYNANQQQGGNWDWTGQQQRKGPPAKTAEKSPPKAPQKKIFGLF